jgi:hypothetical protein
LAALLLDGLKIEVGELEEVLVCFLVILEAACLTMSWVPESPGSDSQAILSAKREKRDLEAESTKDIVMGCLLAAGGKKRNAEMEEEDDGKSSRDPRRPSCSCRYLQDKAAVVWRQNRDKVSKVSFSCRERRKLNIGTGYDGKYIPARVPEGREERGGGAYPPWSLALDDLVLVVGARACGSRDDVDPS